MTTGRDLDGARRLVTGFLSGEIDELTHRAVFEDDAFLFAVAKLDAGDPAWILDRLADRRWPLARRREILGPMVDHYEEGIAILRREDARLDRNRPPPDHGTA